jgi:hypothetical protein
MIMQLILIVFTGSIQASNSCHEHCGKINEETLVPVTVNFSCKPGTERISKLVNAREACNELCSNKDAVNSFGECLDNSAEKSTMDCLKSALHNPERRTEDLNLVIAAGSFIKCDLKKPDGNGNYILINSLTTYPHFHNPDDKKMVTDELDFIPNQEIGGSEVCKKDAEMVFKENKAKTYANFLIYSRKNEDRALAEKQVLLDTIELYRKENEELNQNRATKHECSIKIDGKPFEGKVECSFHLLRAFNAYIVDKNNDVTPLMKKDQSIIFKKAGISNLVIPH